jgi:CheY-like chemotaxis protein
MKGSSRHSLLWIDDDAPERFMYENFVLSQNGWEITWATSAEAGAEALRDRPFKVVILDQMLPWSTNGLGRDLAEVWAGCLLLAWLRDKRRPSKAPPREAFERLYTMNPLGANRTVPVILGSAYYDDEIMASLFEIEPQLPQVPKPIDCSRLLEILASVGLK